MSSIIIYKGDDTAADWFPEAGAWDFPPAYDEWLALRAAVGLPPVDFDQYLVAIDVPAWQGMTALSLAAEHE